MWSDNETTLDLLGFQVHADLVRSVVTDRKLLPLTIGVFGDWGGGKTSIMKMLQRDLDPEKCDPKLRPRYERLACLYFNGWLFEGYDDAKSAILTSVLLQLGEHKRFGPKIREKVASLLKSVNWMRVVRLGVQEVALPALSAYVTGGASLIPALAGTATKLFTGDEGKKANPAGDKVDVDWERLIEADRAQSGPLDVRSFRDRFSNMLRDSDIDTLVVLIDDLDRCSPDRILDNLEAIKLFLNVDNTAFVIGADPRIVRHAILLRYGSAREIEPDSEPNSTDRLVDDYLEKLIQVPYYLPRLSPSEIETYMALLFCLRDLDEGAAAKCLKAYAEMREKDRYSVFGYASVKQALGGETPENLETSLVFCAAAAPLISEGLKGNPRQVKRFLNAFVLRHQLARVAGLDNVNADVLVKLMVLEYSHPKQFRQLFDWQVADSGFPKQIRLLEDALLPPKGKIDGEIPVAEAGWATSSIRRWVCMEPRLSDTDLRDYFWVTRDRLQSTLTSLSMVPPVVRSLLRDLLSNEVNRSQALKLAMPLEPDEKSLLLEQLVKQIERQPDQQAGYDALLALVGAEFPGGTEALVEVLNSCPGNLIPPAVAPQIFILRKGKPAIKGLLDPVLNRFGTDSKFGTAVRTMKSREG